MSDLADLFPGFASHWIDTDAGQAFSPARAAAARPLVLLHGFPQTPCHVAPGGPELAKRFTVVAMDLRGYGWSTAPRSDENGVEVYSKRAMAEDVVKVMEELGHVRFAAGRARPGRAGGLSAGAGSSRPGGAARRARHHADAG